MVPVITTMTIDQPPVITVPDAIVFTSVHAVRHFPHNNEISSVPVCVASSLVAEAALAAGYITVTSTAANDDALAGLLRHLLQPAARILLLCGDKASPRLADCLRAMTYDVDRRVVYKPVPVEDDALAHVADVLHTISAIVVHSSGGAERIVPMLRAADWNGSLWCISEQAAQACGDLRHISVQTATQPSEAALLDMIIRLTPKVARRRSPAPRANADMLLSALRTRSSSGRIKAGNDNFQLNRRRDELDPDPTAA